VSEPLPAPLDGTALRILATSDLGATTVPLRTRYGEGGTCAGVVALLERERERQPTIWLDAGDLVVGTPAYPLLGERPWGDIADLPIAAAAAGNPDFDDGVEGSGTGAACRRARASATSRRPRSPPCRAWSPISPSGRAATSSPSRPAGVSAFDAVVGALA
jgi:hypothetical protein